MTLYFLNGYAKLMDISMKAYAFHHRKNINYKLSTKKRKNLSNLQKQLII